jgi:hypothetical protein
VSGARLSAGGRLAGESDAEGTVAATLGGKTGSDVAISVECPEGFLTENRPAHLRLVRTRPAIGPEAPAPLVWTGLCRRAEREIALMVHTDALSDLPVIVNGVALTRTNADGNAHVLLTLAHDVASVHVSLDTSSDPRLKPENPARVFAASDTDGLLVFDPAVARARSTPKTARPVRRPIPYRVR